MDMAKSEKIINSYAEQQRKAFAEILKTLRKNAGLTQKQLADKSGIGLSVIARYETAGALPRPKAIEKLATALDVPPYALDYSVGRGSYFETAPLRAHGVNVIVLGNGWIRISIPGSNEIELPTETCKVLYEYCVNETDTAFKNIISEYRINLFIREAFKWYQDNCIVPGPGSVPDPDDQHDKK